MIILAGIFCCLCLLVTGFTTGNAYEVWLLSMGQLALLAALASRKHVTGVTMFMFMSFLFFGIRPIYILLERDYSLFGFPFAIAVDRKILNSAQWWATLSLLCFYVGSRFSYKIHLKRWRRMRLNARRSKRRVLVYTSTVFWVLAYQVVSLGIMFVLGSFGKSLYSAGGGAYLYDAPALLQGGQIFAISVLLERYLRLRNTSTAIPFFLSVTIFLIFTYEMRNVSLFRGFYLTGLIAGGLAVLSRIKRNVRAYWLIVPIFVAFPLFRMLGQMRGAENDNLSSEVMESFHDQDVPLLTMYWNFYDARGDINIFDTFVAAKVFEPAFKPYAWSWLYVPVHLVPRAFWKSKPEGGVLIDGSFTNGAPYSPGISGFFLLDGGLLWMLGCMALLGYLLSCLDLYVLSMATGYLRSCLYGIVVVNAMGCSRYFLYQYFYQVLYAAIPVIVFAWFVTRMGESAPRGRKMLAPRTASPR